jgi:hypothetical protein
MPNKDNNNLSRYLKRKLDLEEAREEVEQLIKRRTPEDNDGGSGSISIMQRNSDPDDPSSISTSDLHDEVNISRVNFLNLIIIVLFINFISVECSTAPNHSESELWG